MSALTEAERPGRRQKLTPISTGRFVATVLACSVGFYLWSFPEHSVLRDVGGVVVLFSMFLPMSQEERGRRRRRGDSRIMLFVMGVALIIVASERWFPGSLRSFSWLIQAPWFLGALWLLVVGHAFRKWRAPRVAENPAE